MTASRGCLQGSQRYTCWSTRAIAAHDGAHVGAAGAGHDGAAHDGAHVGTAGAGHDGAS